MTAPETLLLLLARLLLLHLLLALLHRLHLLLLHLLHVLHHGQHIIILPAKRVVAARALLHGSRNYLYREGIGLERMACCVFGYNGWNRECSFMFWLNDVCERDCLRLSHVVT